MTQAYQTASQKESLVLLYCLSEEPTPSEAATLASYAAYLKTRGYVSSSIVCKRDDGGWGYRRETWDLGPYFWPDYLAFNYQPLSLLAVLDKDQSIGGEPWQPWEDWKAQHPEVRRCG